MGGLVLFRGGLVNVGYGMGEFWRAISRVDQTIAGGRSSGWGLDWPGGIRAAVAEFEGSGYHYIVASGGLTSGRWEDEPASYAKMAADEMIRLGIPKGKDSSRHPGLHRKAADIGICRCRVASPAECRYPA